MSDVILIVVLIAACMCIAFGAVRIAGWLIDRHEEAAHRQIRDDAFVAQARAELSATGWTEEEERAYQRQRFAYARDERGYLDLDRLAPCDEAAFYGFEDGAAGVDRG